MGDRVAGFVHWVKLTSARKNLTLLRPDRFIRLCAAGSLVVREGRTQRSSPAVMKPHVVAGALAYLEPGLPSATISRNQDAIIIVHSSCSCVLSRLV